MKDFYQKTAFSKSIISLDKEVPENIPCEESAEGGCSTNWTESRAVASLPPCTLQGRARTGERRLCTTVVIGPDL